LTCLIRSMTQIDIPQVTEIDREAFATMWPPVNFHHEMTNRLAHYAVACDGKKVCENPEPAIRLVPVRSFWGIKWPFSPKPEAQRPPEPIDYITGFVGLWMMVDEAHIINIAVRSDLRGNGIGELLLISGIDIASKLKAEFVTLEVRVSNNTARKLYSKYGFKEVGLRKGYYTDNKEDALIMTTDTIHSDAYQRHYQILKQTHLQKMGEVNYQIGR
jgi:ribosomal-protein-alanine N-acetyltransferase